ncbi:MAG: YbdK family carboxylate-amine ligase [Casimicrobium sp.]
MIFADSKALTFGMELELQIVNKETGKLSPSSLEIWREASLRNDAERFSMEATQATIELNTSIHSSADTMLEETLHLVATLRNIAAASGVDIRGGGTQVNQFWNDRVLSPTARAVELSTKFGFLPKRFSTYGMHVHIGVPSGDAAIHLANSLQALCPLFIAMSAASPLLQMTDTGFCAARPLEPLVYPHGGPMPRLGSWAEFESIASEIFSTGLADSLKDIYWDVRPKPEFGTVEVRVFDTPMSVYKAVAMAAFTRACAALVLDGTLSLPVATNPYSTSRVSRFVACRDGMDAKLFNPFEGRWLPALEWLRNLFDAVGTSPLCESDAQHIKSLETLWMPLQDCDIMRRAWARIVAAHPLESDATAALSEYSKVVCAHLLQDRDGSQSVRSN